MIVKINGQDLNKLKLSDCVGMLRGEVGTTVELGVRRAGVKDELSMHVVRGTVEVPSVVGAHILPDSGGIGYLRILQFSRETPDRLDSALAKLSAEGMTSLVIDLRNNPGGIVDSAVEVCSRFVKEDQTLVTLEWRDPSKNQTYKTVNCTKYYNLPVILLVNGNSASAAAEARFSRWMGNPVNSSTALRRFFPAISSVSLSRTSPVSISMVPETAIPIPRIRLWA